jgi:hypothetical protein
MLNETLFGDVGSAGGHQAMAKAVIPSDPGKEPRRAAEAVHLARRALRFAPDLPELREVFERVSRQADRTDRRTD